MTTNQTATAVPSAESAALDTLYDAMLRASQAFSAVQARIANGGKVQRLGPGVWVITRELPDVAPESPE